MRALAHPLRLRLLGMLRMEGPSTASQLAQQVGEVPALVSYHLRQLAANGFLEEAPELARDGRERWWRSAHDFTSWNAADFLDSPERRAAELGLRRLVYDAYQQRLEEFLLEESAWDPEWVAAADSSDYLLRLDAAGLAALRTELGEVMQRYRTDPPPARGPVEHVQVIFHLFPRTRGTG
jgi:DNA-binding transcriptional ArsR family regulator